MSANNIVPFQFELQEVRVVEVGGEPWFILSDVCDALGISNPSQLASRLDEDEKGIFSNDTLGGRQNVLIVSESGLYEAAFSSRKEEAKRFRRWVRREVLPAIRKTGTFSAEQGTVLPYHLHRHLLNVKNVPAGYFSILSEMAITIIAQMEAEGYTMPESMWPDISQGIMFSAWLKNNGVDTSDVVTYWHEFEDGRPSVRAKAYPERLLPDFRLHLREVWIPKKAAAYFAKRDPAALQILGKIYPQALPKE